LFHRGHFDWFYGFDAEWFDDGFHGGFLNENTMSYIKCILSVIREMIDAIYVKL